MHINSTAMREAEDRHRHVIIVTQIEVSFNDSMACHKKRFFRRSSSFSSIQPNEND